MKKGRALEILIQTIESAIAGHKHIEIRSPKRLKDKRTGELREHDVVITYKVDRHEFITAIECRDKQAKVGTPEVEAFIAKCQDTGVEKKIIVSTSGFTKPSLIKAKDAGIKCLTLEEIKSINWLHTDYVMIIAPKVVHQDWKLFPKDSSFTKLEDFNIFVDDVEFTKEVMIANGTRAFNEYHAKPDCNLSEGSHKVKIGFDPQNFILKRKSDGSLFEIKEVYCLLSVEITNQQFPFTFSTYKEVDSFESISQVAITPTIDVGTIKYKVLMVNQEDKGTRVMLLPDPV